MKKDVLNLKEDDNGEIGEIDELSALDKAKFKMTYWVLGIAAVLFVASGAAYIFTTNSEAAKDVFEFCKTFLPPVVTLVLGAHYVTKEPR